MRKKLIYIIGFILFVGANILIRNSVLDHTKVIGMLLAGCNILMVLSALETMVSIQSGGELLIRHRRNSRIKRSIKAGGFIVGGLAIFICIKYIFRGNNMDDSRQFVAWMIFTYYIILTGSLILSDYNGIQVREKMLVNCFSYYRWKRIKSVGLTPDHLLKIRVEKKFKDEDISIQLDEDSSPRFEKVIAQYTSV